MGRDTTTIEQILEDGDATGLKLQALERALLMLNLRITQALARIARIEDRLQKLEKAGDHAQ